MDKSTPTIKYNLKERGRFHSGVPRNYNIRLLVDKINGKECQERVSTRGMIGYYGHMPRIRSGMVMPVEGIFDGGKYMPVEPAMVTTHLSATLDGTVEHRAEFLDTASGVLAQKMFSSKIGGFSTAIDEASGTFAGFDYVVEPNFLANSWRGMALDDATSTTYDSIYAAELTEHQRNATILLNGLNAEREASAMVIDRLKGENEQLLSMLSRQGMVLDSAVPELPLMLNIDHAERMKNSIRSFGSAKLSETAFPFEVLETPLETRLRAQIHRR